MKATVLMYVTGENKDEAIDEAIEKFEERMREAYAYLMVDSNMKIKEVRQ
jgi:hypothetical protein